MSSTREELPSKGKTPQTNDLLSSGTAFFGQARSQPITIPQNKRPTGARYEVSVNSAQGLSCQKLDLSDELGLFNLEENFTLGAPALKSPSSDEARSLFGKNHSATPSGSHTHPQLKK